MKDADPLAAPGGSGGLTARAAEALRRAIQVQVFELVGGPVRDAAGRPVVSMGDAGLFGPKAVCWQVHGDLTTMLVGGVAALLLQMLHPSALAGVWDHSDFRQDRLGRLKRTARFVSGVTYGASEHALGLIAHVRSIHDRVCGALPDGTPYSANDPALLTWVHVAEVSSFLAAYLRHRGRALSSADQDRYFAETAIIPLKLGAVEVPLSVAAAAAYLEAQRPNLRCDERTREATRILLSPRALSPAVRPFARLIFEAAKDLLPPWAYAMHGFRRARASGLRLGVEDLSVRTLGAALRWALPDNAEVRARRRAAQGEPASP